MEYLKKGYFDHDVPKEERNQIIIKASLYTLYDRQLYKSRLHGVLQQCVFLEEVSKILEDFHEGLIGGHFGINTIGKKMLSLGYWCPTMHKNDVELCQNYDICQCLKCIWQSGKGPLKSVMAFEPFMKWGLDFMGPVKTVARYTRNQYIIVIIDNTTKWVEAKALHDNTTKNIVKFIYEQIIIHFGCSTHLVNDQGSHFINKTIEILVEEFMISHHKSTIYYLQRNKQAELTNKTLGQILAKLINAN